MPDLKALGEHIADLIADAVGPLQAEIASLREQVREAKAIRAEKGDPGEPGAPGQDAEPVAVPDVVAELVRCADLRPVLDLLVTEAVAKHMADNPIPPPKDGRDGADGAPGPKGEPGEKGLDGKDGVGLAGAMIDRTGALVVTLTNGEAKSLGPVVGRDGVDGKDGLSFENATGLFDADRGFVVTLAGSGRTAEFVLPYMVHRGFWSEGKAVKAGESATHDGGLWIAKRETTAKPCLENAGDWILAARKGRDGKDGRNGIDRTAAVKVAPDA